MLLSFIAIHSLDSNDSMHGSLQPYFTALANPPQHERSATAAILWAFLGFSLLGICILALKWFPEWVLPVPVKSLVPQGNSQSQRRTEGGGKSHPRSRIIHDDVDRSRHNPGRHTSSPYQSYQQNASRLQNDDITFHGDNDDPFDDHDGFTIELSRIASSDQSPFQYSQSSTPVGGQYVDPYLDTVQPLTSQDRVMALDPINNVGFTSNHHPVSSGRTINTHQVAVSDIPPIIYGDDDEFSEAFTSDGHDSILHSLTSPTKQVNPTDFKDPHQHHFSLQDL